MYTPQIYSGTNVHANMPYCETRMKGLPTSIGVMCIHLPTTPFIYHPIHLPLAWRARLLGEGPCTLDKLRQCPSIQKFSSRQQQQTAQVALDLRVRVIGVALLLFRAGCRVLRTTVVVARVAHETQPVRTGHSWAAQQTRIQTEGAGPATRARSPPGYGYDSLGVPTDLAVVPWRKTSDLCRFSSGKVFPEKVDFRLPS